MDMGWTSNGALPIGADTPSPEWLIGPWSKLVGAIERLAGSTSLEAVIEVLRSTARGIVGADGIAIVLRDGDQCHYIAEDACAPLWAGQRFPVINCVSGWSMQRRETAIIPDIFVDPRVPVEAYASTFVRGMMMVPIGDPQAIAAMGAYWSTTHQPSEREISMFEALARSAATAFANVQLFETLEARVEERTRELERTHEQLRQFQKIETVGQLTGNVAHDFNNLLTPIISSLDLILHRGLEDERLMRNVSRAMEAAERARLLVKRLLAFARRQPLRPTMVDLAALIAGVNDLLVSTVGPRIDIQQTFDPALPLVSVDANQLELAILNLAVNARDAMPNGGTLWLTTTPLRDEERPDGLGDGRYLCFEMRDEGAGMDAETLTRAIEPFFSTKEEGQGTGLGLSMVHGLMAQLGGGMDILSSPGAGTRVRLFVPIATDIRSDDLLAEEEDRGSARNKGLALIVDDNPLVRSSTSEMLLEIGFDVIEAETADHGLSLIRKGLAPKIVVTDHLMPGMTGAEFARILKIEHPSIPVLLISGYQNIETIAHDIPRLAKPFRHMDLDRKVAAVLGHA